MKELMIKVFEAWKTGSKLEPALFSKGFVYRGPSKMMDANVWLELQSDKNASEDVNLLCAISEQDKGALLFEWKEPVTLLTYRTSWFFKFEEGAICELIETKEPVEV